MYENIEKEKRIRKIEGIWLISGYLFAIALFLAGILVWHLAILSSLVVASVSYFIYAIFSGMIIAIAEEYLN